MIEDQKVAFRALKSLTFILILPSESKQVWLSVMKVITSETTRNQSLDLQDWYPSTILINLNGHGQYIGKLMLTT